MLDAVLTQKKVKLGVKVTVKTIVSASLIALVVVLPQLVHVVAGASGGMTWLPMYLPVLLAGCLLGTWWGLGVGVLSPVVSFLITSIAGNPMPVLARLPFMIVELAVFAGVSGIFSKKIMKNDWIAFPAVLLAAVCGRAVFIALVAIFQSVSSLSVALVWSQIQSGLIGLVLQAVLVPIIVISVKKLMVKNDGQIE